MRDDQVTFEEWWGDFGRTKRESGNVAVLDVLAYAAHLSDAKRGAFIDGLVNVGWLRDRSDVTLARWKSSHRGPFDAGLHKRLGSFRGCIRPITSATTGQAS